MPPLSRPHARTAPSNPLSTLAGTAGGVESVAGSTAPLAAGFHTLLVELVSRECPGWGECGE